MAGPASMNILAFDTCLGACSAAAARDATTPDARFALRHARMATGHAEALMPMIDAVLAEAGLAAGEIDRIAVTNGPGTFTGTRIGVAAARALALATRAELCAISSLAALAETARRELPAGSAPPSEILAVVDARRGEVYAALFGSTSADIHVAPCVLPIAEAVRLPRTTGALVAGTGAEAVLAAGLVAHGTGLVQAGLEPSAAALIDLAILSTPEAHPVRPLYLRAPDAKPQAITEIRGG
jgi:tRNA threonylcarbamoyladenosine biosynthesis protein TsaB